MKSDNRDAATKPHGNYVINAERWLGADSAWRPRTNDAGDSLRVDTIEALRSELLARPKSSNRETENARLRARVRHLSRENNDMNNMLAGTGVATVFLDRRLEVVRITPGADQIVNLTTDSIGRPVSGTVSSPIGYDRMMEDARSVLETLRSKQVDVQVGNGRWYQMHIHPYRTVDATIEGVVISLFETTDSRNAEQEVARRLAEKETLLKEVHHRVRNNTASISGLLSIRAQSVEDPQARSVLKDAIGWVESMNTLYDRLLVSEEYAATSVKKYLDGLADSVMALFPEESGITLEKRIVNFDLKPGDLFLIGLITNELLNNVVKHAFGSRAHGLIILSLERSENRATLTVQDDGAGLPPGSDVELTNGFGLSLVRMLSEQLGGSFSISTRNGTRCVLELDL